MVVRCCCCFLLLNSLHFQSFVIRYSVLPHTFWKEVRPPKKTNLYTYTKRQASCLHVHVACIYCSWFARCPFNRTMTYVEKFESCMEDRHCLVIYGRHYMAVSGKVPVGNNNNSVVELRMQQIGLAGPIACPLGPMGPVGPLGSIWPHGLKGPCRPMGPYAPMGSMGRRRFGTEAGPTESDNAV